MNLFVEHEDDILMRAYPISTGSYRDKLYGCVGPSLAIGPGALITQLAK